MEYLFIILPKMVSFVLLPLIGIFLVKIKVVDDKNISVISGLLIKAVLPMMNISLVYERRITFISLWSYRNMILWQIILYLLLALTGILCTKAARMPYPKCNIHRGCTVGGNYSYVVLPLVYALFDGTYGVDYIPVCSTVDTLVVWTLGLSLFTWDKNGGGSVSFKKLCNGINASILFALLINSLSLTIPKAVMDVVSQVGDLSKTLGLIFMGCTIALVKDFKPANLKPVSLLILTKLLLIPTLIYALSSRFLPQTESVILMLIAGAPSMTTSLIVAEQYNLDREYAAEAVFLTTVACLFTVPALFLIISLF